MYPVYLNSLPTTQQSRAYPEHGIYAQGVTTLKRVTPRGTTCNKSELRRFPRLRMLTKFVRFAAAL
jgi:hypothetical protein